MRSSSVKTLVITISLVAVVSAATPAEARPARPSSRTTVSAPKKQDAVARAIATAKALQKRFSGVINFSLVSPPWPGLVEAASTFIDPLTITTND